MLKPDSGWDGRHTQRHDPGNDAQKTGIVFGGLWLLNQGQLCT